MKKLFYIGSIALIVASCSSPKDKKGTADTTVAGDTISKTADTAVAGNKPAISSLCFLRTEGKEHQDSTSVELVVKGSKVSGIMNWLPWQKDSRKGTLNGEVKGDTVLATWTFMQEGVKDTLNLKFKLDSSQLLQKPLKLNTKTGRQQTDEKAGYTVVYKPSAKVKH